MSEQTETVTFSDFPFRESIFTDLEAAGFEKPTPIQAAFIPTALDGRDAIGLAQTGTGKTAAFALPIIHAMAHGADMAALVLAPTRELAHQITAMFEELGRSSGIRVATVVGGIPLSEDWKALASWPNVLVATPGRLIDHIESNAVCLDGIRVLVVDEADRMHDMGFIPQIRRILEALPTERQTLMLTATMPKDVERIARRHMADAERIQIGRRSAPAERAEQQLFRVSQRDKTPLLLKLLEEAEGRVLVFVRTKVGVDRLASAVRRRGHNATRIHSDRSQPERDEAMEGFREGRYPILIATDIAARGLDIEDIEHVINYDFPQSAEDYVHRIGRTARLRKKGLATTFVTRADRRHLAALERLLNEPLVLKNPDGSEAPRSGKSRSRRGGGRGRSSGKSRRGKRRSRKKAKA
ncbi:MAG: DEAD/DEAH box helicase [Planctomycetota bacterium]